MKNLLIVDEDVEGVVVLDELVDDEVGRCSCAMRNWLN